MKRCIGFKTESHWLDSDQFNKDSNKEDGLQSYCRNCQKIIKKQGRDRNRSRKDSTIKFVIEKRCSKCKITKAGNLFNKSKGNNDGLKYECRDCENEYKREDRKLKRTRDLSHILNFTEKLCSRCKRNLPKSEFYPNLNNNDGFHNQCVECISVSQRCYKYGFTNDLYFDTINKQNNKCAICLKQFNKKQKVYVDHFHVLNFFSLPGKEKFLFVRDLLCIHCNWMIGFAEENSDILRGAIEYLAINKSSPSSLLYSSDRFKNNKISTIFFQNQNGDCTVCKIQFLNKKRALDHNKNTGVVRGLIHQKCNLLLGHARENPQILLNAISYLQKWSHLKNFPIPIIAQ